MPYEEVIYYSDSQRETQNKINYWKLLFKKMCFKIETSVYSLGLLKEYKNVRPLFK
jgi:hypothetical protein